MEAVMERGKDGGRVCVRACVQEREELWAERGMVIHK